MDEADVDEIRRSEEQLLQLDVRRDVARLAALLHPDFVEFGSSGNRWTRESLLARLPEESAFSAELNDFVVAALSPDVALATYRVKITTDPNAPRSSLRSSIWVRDEGSWRVRFHQGTGLDPSPA